MKTLQGKEFEHNDILLCNVENWDIDLLVNDVDQISKYKKVRFTKNTPKNMPIGKVMCTRDNFISILGKMKQISSYKENLDGDIEVTYFDGTVVLFDAKEKDVIRKNYEAQRELASQTKIGNWSDIESNKIVGTWFDENEEEYTVIETREATKEEKENKNSHIGRKVVAVLLAAALAVGAYYVGLYYARKNKATLTDDEANYISGVYPTEMEEMNEEEAEKRANEILESIDNAVIRNLDPDTKEYDMLDFGSYIQTEDERNLVNEVMNISRELILSEAKSEEEHKAAIVRYLNYQFDTINSPEFLTMPSGTRYLITTIFYEANQSLPKESFVTREKSEDDVREYDLYYRYFTNNYERKVYLPERLNDEIIYVHTFEDCSREVYTEEQMLAMAGMASVNDQIALGIMADANIEEMGVKPEVELRREEAKAEFLTLNNVYTLTK